MESHESGDKNEELKDKLSKLNQLNFAREDKDLEKFLKELRQQVKKWWMFFT